MSEEEIQNDEPIIPEEDFREAIAACRQDPELDRYFKYAPPAARLFIGLSFYSTHFGEKTDPAQYKACLEEIEPSLMPDDLKYLIRFERDKETKKYLRGLLARREEEQAQVPESPPAGGASVPEPEKVEKPRKGNVASASREKVKVRSSNVQGLKLVTDAEPTAGRPLVPILIGVGVVVFMCGVLLVHSRVKVGGELEQRNGDVERLRRRVEELQVELDRTRVELRKARAAGRAGGTTPGVRHVQSDAEEEVPEQQESAPVEERVEETAVPESGEVVAVTAVKEVQPSAKVVFTDGRSVVRRSNGKLIEVPRTFSYTGAGLKKPFWIYDRKLDEAKMETEAKLEKQARDAWRKLADEARRQEAGTDAF